MSKTVHIGKSHAGDPHVASARTRHGSLLCKKIMGLMAIMSAVVAFGAFDANTIAFYPFDEGDDGDSALGEGLLKNAVNPSLYAGTATTAAADSGLEFSSDVPGSCIFSGASGARILHSDVRSVHAYGSKAANLELSGLSTALASAGTWTLEFFFKIETDEFKDWGQFVKFNPSLSNASISGTLGLSTILYGGVSVLRFWSSGGEHTGTSYLTTGEYRGLWRHLALTYSGSSLKLYVNYTQVGALTLTADTPVADQAVSFMHNACKGRICAVRASSVVRATGEMLRAADVDLPEKMELGEETLAFYPFNEGAAGASLLGKYIFNAADPVSNVGAATITGGELLFDDDAPAKYVFTNAVPGATPFAANPKSVYFKKTSSAGATIDFGALMSDMANNGEGTLEFFWKMESEDEFEGNWNMSVDLGRVFQDGNQDLHKFGILIPLANRTEESYGKKIRMGADGGASNGYSFDYVNFPEDGLWHHLAVVCSDTRVRLYCDYKPASAIGAATSTEYVLKATESLVDLALGNGNFGGKISCLKVSKRALAASEFLHASNLPNYDTGEIFAWHFDEKAVGEAFTTVSNGAVNVLSATPGLYASSGQSSMLADATVSALSGTIYPAAVDRRKNIRDGLSGQIVSFDGCAIRMDVDGAGQSTFANGMDVISTAAQVTTNSFTVETFFRYDRTTMKQDVWDVYPDLYRDRVTVFGVAAQNYNYAWELILNNAKTDTPSLGVWVTYYDTAGATFDGTRSALLADGKWHHVALTYDADANRIQVYLDYKPYLTVELAKQLWGYAPGTNFRLQAFHLGGKSLNNQPFCGWFDGCRLRSGVHPVSSFYRAENLGRGMHIIFR